MDKALDPRTSVSLPKVFHARSRSSHARSYRRRTA
jgi:hypothetical protein